MCEKCGNRIFQISHKDIVCLNCGLCVYNIGKNSDYSRLKPNYKNDKLFFLTKEFIKYIFNKKYNEINEILENR